MTFVDAVDIAGRKAGHIKLHGEEAFAGMRRAGRLAAEALDLLAAQVEARRHHRVLSTRWCSSSRMAHGAYPAPLDYRGYRKSICTSINHVVCHGIPDRQAAAATATSSIST